MRYRLLASVIGIAAETAFLITLARAHDIKGLTVEVKESASPDVANALPNVPRADENMKFVINNLRLWPVPRKLTICFHGGSAALRKRVTGAMRRLWRIGGLSQGRLDYNRESFGNPPDCATPATAL